MTAMPSASERGTTSAMQNIATCVDDHRFEVAGAARGAPDHRRPRQEHERLDDHRRAEDVGHRRVRPPARAHEVEDGEGADGDVDQIRDAKLARHEEDGDRAP